MSLDPAISVALPPPSTARLLSTILLLSTAAHPLAAVPLAAPLQWALPLAPPDLRSTAAVPHLSVTILAQTSNADPTPTA